MRQPRVAASAAANHPRDLPVACQGTTHKVGAVHPQCSKHHIAVPVAGSQGPRFQGLGMCQGFRVYLRVQGPALVMHLSPGGAVCNTHLDVVRMAASCDSSGRKQQQQDLPVAHEGTHTRWECLEYMYEYDVAHLDPKRCRV